MTLLDSDRVKAVLGALLLFSAIALLGSLYTLGGGGSPDRLVAVLLIDAIFVLGIQVFSGNTGTISFGHAGLAAIAAYTTALVTIPEGIKGFVLPDMPFGLADVQLSPMLSVPMAVLAATLVATITGLAISRLTALAAAMLTLVLLVLVHAVIVNWAPLTAGGGALYGIPPVASRGWLLIAFFASLLLARLFRESKYGLRAQATREDALAAAAIGVDTMRARLIPWILSGAIVGVSGALRAHFLGTITADEFFVQLTLISVAMLVVGGMRSVTGAVLGVLVVTAGNEIARFFAKGPDVLGVQLPLIPGLPQMFLGALLIIAVSIRPDGLVRNLEIDSLLPRLRRGRRPHAERPNEAAALSPTRASSLIRRRRLEVDDVSRSYGGLNALVDVSIYVESGETVGVIGPNGAGKTTLMNVISGFTRPGHGDVRVDGRSILELSAKERPRTGIARTFQTVRLFGALTVAQNFEIAFSAAHNPAGNKVAGVPDLLAAFGLTELRDRTSSSLPFALQRRVEVARAIALQPSFLLLDEPAAGMTDAEAEQLLAHVRSFVDGVGGGVLVIDHNVDFISAACDRLYVLHHGEVIAQGTPDEVRASPLVGEAYLGKRLSSHESRSGSRSAEPTEGRTR